MLIDKDEDKVLKSYTSVTFFAGDYQHMDPKRLSLYKGFLHYNVSITFLIKLSNILSQLNETDQLKHIKIILYHLLPRKEGSNQLCAADQIPKISLLRHYLKRNLDLELCNYATGTLVIKHARVFSAVRNLIPQNNETPNSNPYQSKYGTVYTLKGFDYDKYDLGFQVYDKRHIEYPSIINQVDREIVNLPYPPRACIINKNNLIGESLNSQLIAQINKLKQDCVDFEERESTATSIFTTSTSTVFEWIQNSKCNTKILKQYIIDPLLNTHKYLIPSLFYIDKSKHTCEILTEINNCHRLYNS